MINTPSAREEELIREISRCNLWNENLQTRCTPRHMAARPWITLHPATAMIQSTFLCAIQRIFISVLGIQKQDSSKPWAVGMQRALAYLLW